MWRRVQPSPLAFVLLFALASCGGNCEAPADAETWVEIRGQRVQIEIVTEPAEQTRGLGYRDSLAWDNGMLFTYDRPGFYGFWMKGMRFDIDIVWLRDWRIVDITPRLPHTPPLSGALPTYHPRQLTDVVLEVPAGYAEAHGWAVGDTVRRPAQSHNGD